MFVPRLVQVTRNVGNIHARIRFTGDPKPFGFELCKDFVHLVEETGELARDALFVGDVRLALGETDADGLLHPVMVWRRKVSAVRFHVGSELPGH